jgi:coproporphyrinogen III oxidase-like Fe-S oxidoreductase
VGQALVGIGLQSFDNDVLAHVERSYDEARFEQTLYELKSVAGVAIEIILGLPGDSPENFRRTFERARSLPCALRVYHCVVLPSALMVRAPPDYRVDTIRTTSRCAPASAGRTRRSARSASA